MAWFFSSHARYRPLIAIFAGILVMMMAAAGLYMLGMTRLEGQHRDFFSALGFVAETITTTGYGADAHWQTPTMVLFVISLQILGVMMVYMVIPLILIPVLEQRFEARLPTYAKGLRAPVVVVRYGPAVQTLLAELGRAGTDTVVIETEEALARRLVASGQRTVYAEGIASALEHVQLATARALIANGSDEENAGIILAARQRGYAGEILALVEDSVHRRPMQLAGATAVFTPKVMLAATLASRASHRLGPRVRGMQEIGDRVRLAEVRVESHSPLAGQTLAQAAVGERTGCAVVGQWVGGELVTLPSATMRIEPRGILVAIGEQDALDRLSALAAARGRTAHTGPIVVAGYGEVGRKVVELLRQVDEPVQVIDRQAAEGVDLVGDVLDPTMQESAAFDCARTVVLALDSDSATVFATVVIRNQEPEIPIVARVNKAENVDRIHAAGADFALSISQVAGRLLAQRLLGREEIEIEPALKVQRVTAGALAGHRLAELDTRRRTGCSVVAVERGEQVHVRFDRGFTFAADDAVYICGSADAVSGWHQHFPGE